MARLLIALLFFADKTVAWRIERYAGSDFWYALAILSLLFPIQAACWPEHAPKSFAPPSPKPFLIRRQNYPVPVKR